MEIMNLGQLFDWDLLESMGLTELPDELDVHINVLATNALPSDNTNQELVNEVENTLEFAFVIGRAYQKMLAGEPTEGTEGEGHLNIQLSEKAVSTLLNYFLEG